MLKLYHRPRSRSMRTLGLRNELGLDFELVTMPLDLSILRAPEYLAIHPLGRVPCLVDDGRVVFESGAIAQDRCETYPAAGPLHRPPGHPERADFRARPAFQTALADVKLERPPTIAGGRDHASTTSTS